MMYVIDLFVMISRLNDIVVPMPCNDIVLVRSPRRYRMSRSYDSGPKVPQLHTQGGRNPEVTVTDMCSKKCLLVQSPIIACHKLSHMQFGLPLSAVTYGVDLSRQNTCYTNITCQFIFLFFAVIKLY